MRRGDGVNHLELFLNNRLPRHDSILGMDQAHLLEWQIPWSMPGMLGHLFGNNSFVQVMRSEEPATRLRLQYTNVGSLITLTGVAIRQVYTPTYSKNSCPGQVRRP